MAAVSAGTISGRPVRSPSTGTRSAPLREQVEQSRTCRPIRLRHNGAGPPSQGRMTSASRSQRGRAESARTTSRETSSWLFHPLDPHRHVVRAEPERQLGAGEPARDFLPPQRQQLRVVGVERPGGFGHLTPLADQSQPEDREVHEVAGRVPTVATKSDAAVASPSTACGPGSSRWRPGRRRADEAGITENRTFTRIPPIPESLRPRRAGSGSTP